MKNRLFSFRPAALPLAVSCALAALAPSRAQGVANPGADAPMLPGTVVTATRVAQPLTDVLADVTLIDEQQIQASGAVNIADLLQRQPGLALSRNGGAGSASSLYIRGADNRFTAVYIDGVRVDSQATGGAPWEAIALGQVERIEIVRGPAAAIYGSDAVAGVVQVFTKKGEGAFTPYVGVGAGNRRTGKLEAGFSGASGAVDYALGAARDVSRGFNATTFGNPDADGYHQSAFSGRLGLQINADHRLELTGARTEMKAQYDDFMPGNDDVTSNRLFTLGAAWRAQWSQSYSTRLSVSQSQFRTETTPSPYMAKTTLQNYLFQNEWRQGAHLFTAALERRGDKLLTDPIDGSRHQDAVALGYGYSGGPHTLQVNLRHDHDSQFGGQTTGGVAYGYTFAPGWRVTGAAGTSFRVPTLYQRFSEYGDASLTPEKGRNVELGLRWAAQGSSFGVVAYRNRITNLIDFGAAGPCASPYGCYVNTGRAVLRGVTVSGAHKLGPVQLGGSFDLLDPRNAATGKLLARRARRTLKLNADTRLGQWTLGAEWQAASRRYDDAANTTRLGGYGLVNLYASTTIADDWSLLARIDNLGDRNYHLAGGYNTPGRTIYVGLRWSPRR
ncbi:MAG: TonB-dependent receptor [Burkholderiaceae bacterium]|jgi:vitamin B12 transporter|nr:TonB-dependent receptor [Burkholderiaceae bacterium]